MMITKAIENFVRKEYGYLKSESGEREKKINELLIGYHGSIKKKNGNFFVFLRLPEGFIVAIDKKGNLFDLDEI